MSNPIVPESTSNAENEESFQELLSQYEKGQSRKSEDGTRQLEGTVVVVTADSVLIDIGFKSEGILPLSVLGGEAVKPGDKLPVSVQGRDPEGYYTLSRFKVERPKDWTAPVDYRNGTVHVRLEVIEKPAGGEPTTWSVCYIPVKGQGHGYGCIGISAYKEAGVHEQDIAMTKFWQNDDIVWSEGIKEMHLVIKDNSGGSGHAHKRSDHEKFFPTKIRMTLIQVSKGSKYDPSLVPNLPQAGSRK